MTSFILTGSSVTARDLIAGETGIIAQNATLAVSTDDAIDVTGTATVNLLGNIATVGAGNAGIELDAAADSFRLMVGATGSILAADDIGVSGALLRQGSLTNAGTIMGNSAALRLSSFLASDRDTGFVLSNSGTMMATGPASLGDIFEVTGVIELTNFLGTVGTVQLVNSGLIQGGDLVAGIVLIGMNADLQNTGTIVGDILVDGAAAQIANAGVIDGAIQLNTTLGSGQIDDTVINTGTITGSIAMASGNDTFDGRGGLVYGSVNGGTGDDKYFIDQPGLQIIDSLGEDTVQAQCDYAMANGIEVLQLIGPTGLLGTGNSRDNRIFGSSGDDTLRGNRGNDTLDGGDGADDLRGGQGNDVLLAGDLDSVYGDAGNDLIFVADGEATLRGGDGTDIVDGAFASGALAIDLMSGKGSSSLGGLYSLQGIENATGGSGNDTLGGSGGANALLGGGGNDVLTGLNGTDTLDGGEGNDTLDGGGSADLLTGGAGNDSLTGGDGADTLQGDAGFDVLTGGAGADVFDFNALTESAPAAPDLIADFQQPLDRIDLSGIDADGAGVAGDGAFTFIGVTGGFAVGNEVSFTQDAVAGTTTVHIRLAGDIKDAMTLTLTGLITLTADNFVL